jgi:hypothetical protein
MPLYFQYLHLFNISEVLRCLFVLNRTSNISAIWRLSPLLVTGLHFKVLSERPMILPSECRALGEEAINTYFKRHRFDAASPSGARTHDLPFAKREHYH